MNKPLPSNYVTSTVTTIVIVSLALLLIHV